MKRIAIVAGESSGDMLGASLMRALKARYDGLEFYGIAGPRMMDEGAQSLFPLEKLAVRGYVEVLRHLREILAIRRELVARFLDERPDLFIGVDAPDFNLGLEKRLKAGGLRTVQYVAPAVWAWRPGRVREVARAADHVLGIFPIEAPIFERAGVPFTYVGHPLADAMPLEPDRDGARAQLRLGPCAVAVALLPGSRVSELERHADLLIRTARRLLESRPDTRFFVPVTTRETRDYFESRLYALEAREMPFRILFGHARLALHAADVAIVASGTATLEAALARCPMVITYKVPTITYWLMKRKALLPYVGLHNILAGESLVPELIQKHATPERLAEAASSWLDSPDARAAVREKFRCLHESLACGHEARIAEALRPFLAPEAHHGPSADDDRLAAAVRR